MLDEDFVFNQLEQLKVCSCTFFFSNRLFWLLKASSNLQGLYFSHMKVSLFVKLFFSESDA